MIRGKTKRRALWMWALLTLALSTNASACLWDTDTIRDEMQTQANVFHVISGQVPKHGAPYYRARLEASLADLSRRPKDVDVLYDVGAAYLRLGQPDAALATFEKARAVEPERYKTQSNLGVAYHALGRYEDAIRHTRKALALKSDAHFGSGFLYLRMLEHEAKIERGEKPAHSFLGLNAKGRPYTSLGSLQYDRARAAGVEVESGDDRIAPLLTLLRSHDDFAEGYFVLARELEHEHRNLALRALVRAKMLGYRETAAIDKQIDGIRKHWQEAMKVTRVRGSVSSRVEIEDAVRTEIEACQAWSRQFTLVETERVNAGTLPDFDQVNAELERRGIKRRKPTQIGLNITRAGGGSPAEGVHKEQDPANRANAQPSDEHQGGPATDAPPVGGPPVMSVPAQNTAPAPLGSERGDPVAHTRPAGDGDEEPDEGLPWYVPFGLAMLALSLGVGLYARSKAT